MHSNTKESLIDFDRPVPRYTSYPTAPHFKPDVEGSHYKSWLKDLPDGSHLSLYFHIPFCPQLCWFCGCHTKITKRYSSVEDYLSLLIREIEMTADLSAHSGNVTHMHFGGGSPTILKASDFSRLMGSIRNAFSISDGAEIAIEIDPRQINEAKVAAYAKAGVTRASLGVQDFDQRVLESVHREQPFYASYESMKLLRDYGIRNINFDLMYGLPHQTTETMKQTAEYTLLLNPDRIAIFGYAHVPWMKKHMRLLPEKALPDAMERLRLFEVASKIFCDAGYIPVGIDHFAKPGDALAQAKEQGRLYRNFQGYTDDKADALIGMGVSAISRLPAGFTQNSQMLAYRDSILKGRLPKEKFFTLSREDRLRDDIIQSFMCKLSADVGHICQSHGYDPRYFSKEIDTLKPLRNARLIEFEDNGVINIVVPQAARLTCAAFDAYLQPSETSRHVTAT
ncbi:MAG: oxygen-independent coproporphyrinogen III oxidase [Alphaproteobacteria bacterium]|nr:oxygen-independent coproporphyrinogen III oxidase [Alphaproteobacteria bacterium]